VDKRWAAITYFNVSEKVALVQVLLRPVYTVAPPFKIENRFVPMILWRLRV
jgi:hypothetical protein